MTIITKDSEIKLVEYLGNIKNNYENYCAIFFHLSKLKERNKSDFQIRIATNVLSDVMPKHNSEIFLLENKNVVALVNSQQKQLIDKIIYQLRYLFMDDPLAFKKNNQENPEFSTVYVLSFQWNEFQTFCEQLIKVEIEEPQNDNKNFNELAEKEYSEKHNDIFTKIAHDINNLNIKHLIRRQNIAVMVKSNKIKPIYSELFINLAHAKNILDYDKMFEESKLQNIFFREKLDEKFINFIADNPSDYIVGATNIRLNIDLILSDNFINFSKVIRQYTNSSIIISIDLAEVFLDIDSFYYAKQFLQELGYKICINNNDPYSFLLVNNNLFDVDLIKISWDYDVIDEIDISKIKKAIYDINPNRIIFAGCEDESHIAFAQSLNLILFQGLFIDKIINKQKDEILDHN